MPTHGCQINAFEQPMQLLHGEFHHTSASAMCVLIGDAGGTGVLRADNATLTIAGQQSGDAVAGALVVVGNGSGAGAATLANFSMLNISNPGSAGD